MTKYLNIFVLAMCLAVGTRTLFAQGGSCDFTGTWYGGGPTTKYLTNITQDPGGKFNMLGSAAFSQATLGFPVATFFANSIVKGHGNSWEFFGIGLVNRSSGFPAPDPEIWAIHGTAHLSDCNTLQLEYDFFGAYAMSTQKKPFLSTPDYVVVPPPFSETYQRMPTTCRLHETLRGDPRSARCT
jgi:hypothetical protein